MEEDSTRYATESTEATTQRTAVTHSSHLLEGLTQMVSTPLSPVPPYATSSLFTFAYTTPTSPTSSFITSSNTVKTLTVTNSSSPPGKLVKPNPALNADTTSKVLANANKKLVYRKEGHGMGPMVSNIAF
jgi:hypothetical protein